VVVANKVGGPDGGVEVGAGWRIVAPYRKSTHSNIDVDECVEVAGTAAGHRWVRDSKLGDTSPALPVCAGAFDALLSAIRDGGLA